MPKVLDDNFLVCSDCIMAIANNDYSGLDYQHDAGEAHRRAREIKQGIQNAEGHIAPGDHVREFCSSPCDCCGSPLAGARHTCTLLEH